VESVFRLEFAFLPHKVLKSNEFVSTCSALSDRFHAMDENDIFGKDISAKIVPADGLTFYLRSIWDQIVSNKDIDLPSQQELLAQYRCAELSQSAFETFAKNIEVAKSEEMEEWLRIVSTEKNVSVETFSSVAHRYSQDVYEKAVLELYARVDSYILPLLMERLQLLRVQELDIYRRSFQVLATTYETYVNPMCVEV
jgi:protein SEY1